MEINIFPQTVSSVAKAERNFGSGFSRDAAAGVAVDHLGDRDGLSSVRELVESGVIYQNPLLMAQTVGNSHFEERVFQPNVVAEYKVNPVKAIYDSQKARD